MKCDAGRFANVTGTVNCANCTASGTLARLGALLPDCQRENILKELWNAHRTNSRCRRRSMQAVQSLPRCEWGRQLPPLFRRPDMTHMLRPRTDLVPDLNLGHGSYWARRTYMRLAPPKRIPSASRPKIVPCTNLKSIRRTSTTIVCARTYLLAPLESM